MAKKKASDGITLSEFRAWLQGVEEMQGPDWAPSIEQWRRIKAKFNDISEEEVVAPAAPAVRAGYVAPQPFQQFQPGTMPAPPMPMQPSGLQMGQSGGTKTPDIDSSNGYQSSLV